MANSTDDHLARVRAASDRAFADMHAKADHEMANFLRQYGHGRAVSLPSTSGGASMAPTEYSERFSEPEGGPSLQAPAPQQTPAPIKTPTPQKAPTPQQAPTPQIAPVTQNPNLAPPEPLVDEADALFEATGIDFGAISKDQVQDSMDDLKEDFGKLSSSLKLESRSVAKDAARGASDLVQTSAHDLGRRAKEQAEALKAAARQAMEEEKSLKAMKGRAAAEARKARDRMAAEAKEAKDELVGNLKGLAMDKLSFLKDKAEDVLEVGQDALERELGDLRSGQDTP